MDSSTVQQSDLDRLNDKDKQELRTFIDHESKKTRIQAQSHNLTDICWKKCVTGAVKSNALDKGEQSCLANCVDRFFDVNLATMRHIQNMRPSS